MKKTVTLLLFILIGFAKLNAQDGLDNYRRMGNEFNASKSYESAIEVYERLLFFGDDQLSKQIYLPLARAYSAIGKFELASNHYTNAYNAQTVDTIRYEILIESALNYMMDMDTSLAYSELLNISETNLSPRLYNKLQMMLGALDYKSGRYSSAKEHFLRISVLSATDKLAIETLFKQSAKINKRYNPKMVEWMSIIPGLGYAWCGYYKESANAIALSGALVLLYVDVSLKYRIIDGLITVFPWFNRYYRGGIKKSYKLAVTKRQTEQNKLYNTLLRIVPPLN